MKRILENLRSKPVRTRLTILYFFTLLAAVLLLASWANSFGSNFSNTENQAAVKQGLEPLSVLKDNIADGINSLKSSAPKW